MTVPDQTQLHDALFTAIRAEIDDSLSFIIGSKILPRGERQPDVGPTVRDYLADQIAWKFLGVLDGSLGEISAGLATQCAEADATPYDPDDEI